MTIWLDYKIDIDIDIDIDIETIDSHSTIRL